MLGNEDDRKIHTKYYLPKLKVKYYNVLINGKNFFDRLVKSDTRAFDKIRKIATGQGDDYTTGCLLN